jgi:WhiB family redox-sensing transcriptional regulator
MTAPLRPRILAYVAEHPGQTSYEIALGLGVRNHARKPAAERVMRILRNAERAATVVAALEWRAQQGKPVNVWAIAPPGTVPPELTPQQRAARENRRRRNTLSKRRARARSRGEVLEDGAEIPAPVPGPPIPAAWRLPGRPACRDADPGLFFPGPGESDAAAKAICAACTVRLTCLAIAITNRERAGVWGGLNLDPERQDVAA